MKSQSITKRGRGGSITEILESRIVPAFFSPIDLASLAAPDGSTISGETAFDQSGFSVSDAGDVNGDGLDDFIIGANKASPGGLNQAGAVYVVFGATDRFGANFDLSSLDGANGFKLNGAAASDTAGWSVGRAGDVNGDGFDDVIVGTPGTGTVTGAAYVVFGKASGFSASLSLSALNGSNGFKMIGSSAGERAGWDVSGAGDMNGDGFADVVVGAYRANNQTGRAYVVFGKSGPWTDTLNLSALNGSNGFKMDGKADSDNFGGAVGAAGDFNGDGVDDVIVSANAADNGGTQNVGATYVIFGKKTPFAASFDVGTLNGSNGFKMFGVAQSDDVGDSVSGVGDINGDGLADVIAGAFRADPNGNYSGASYVVYGTRTPPVAPLALSALDGTNGFKISGEAFSDFAGYAVKGAGDLNGDGYNDMAIGAPRSGQFISNQLSGAGYVVFGRPGTFGSEFQLSSVDGSNGFKMLGAAIQDYAGLSISGAGDVDGDGFDDVIISAYFADPNGAQKAGKSYVIYGKQSIIAELGAHGSASFLDGSGQRITITVNKGGLSYDNVILRGLPGGGAELLRLDLSDPVFQGATVKITAAPAGSSKVKLAHRSALAAAGEPLASGFVNVGLLDATGVDLGKVTIDGDVARILAGDADVTTPAFVSLTARSMGLLGNSLLTVDDVGPSEIIGPVKALKVITDISDFTLSAGSIPTLTIGGSVSGLDLAVPSIGTLKIAGSVTDSRFLLAGTAAPAKSGAASVLKTGTIGGSFTRSQLLAGYDAMGNPVHADVSIGTLTVTGNWIASDLAVGVSAGAGGAFGDDDDSLIAGGSSAIIARIAKLIIKGDAYGSLPGGDQFGILAEQIGSASIGKTKIPLSKSSADDFLFGATADFRIRELVV